MRTLNVGLTAEQKAKRASCIGGSDANIIMSGDPNAIMDLWLVKTGQKETENLDGVLPVVMGQWTEELNRYWFEMVTGNQITAEGDEWSDAFLDWRTATLDGMTMVNGKTAIFEAKHVNAFSDLDEVVQKYMPQLHHNMDVRGVDTAVLSIFKGTLSYEWFLVERDAAYAQILFEREQEFWACVQNRTAPGDMPAVEAPAKPTEFRKYDFTGNNEWASHAADWCANKTAADTFKAAEKNIKAIVPEDASEVTGHSIIVKRSKAGALSIRSAA